jgi:hypothetical protein
MYLIGASGYTFEKSFHKEEKSKIFFTNSMCEIITASAAKKRSEVTPEILSADFIKVKFSVKIGLVLL